jgi:Rrf2 family nitric oxide-sensitive transcriptional repressor
MQLTKHTDYALRVLIYLALQEETERSTITEISEHFEISRNHLVKIVNRLGKLGYVNTIRGKSGGITLKMPPGMIVIGQVVRNMEVQLNIVDCSNPPCPIIGQCKLKGVLNKARDAFMGVLDQYTLADLVKRPDELKRLLA